MVSPEKKLANAMGGKTARACDRCIRKRARWYCASDDVFLCQFCDSLVHSSNSNPNLARGHERVRLKLSLIEIDEPPSWHQGFTKKSRTPRGKLNNNKDRLSRYRMQNRLHLVPEIGSDHDHLNNNAVNSDDSFCISGEFNDMVVPIRADSTKDEESEFDLNGLILPSDLELAEFAADVESLLGKSTLDEESFNMECGLSDFERVKEEEEVPLELSFDYDYLSVWEEEEEDGEKKVVKKEDEKCVVVEDDDDDRISSKKNRKMLKLDYEGIMAAWDEERSPWATGDRPELDPNDSNWLHCMGGCGKMQHCECGDMGMNMMTRLDGGREARVSRYREKRRTRLFSKKIRYEVRKLNAEKRPRIKGRFVKRPTANSVY